MRGFSCEKAKAKVNLTLHIEGRRPDGYHELQSLVVFADDVCDVVSFTEGSEDSLTVTGPFASAAGNAADNLVFKARDVASAFLRIPIVGAFTLEKNIPVAAGLGGGSSDAAATLRGLLRVYGNDDLVDRFPAASTASVGADVPVCVAQKISWMWGIGERLSDVKLQPPLPAVLVNPRIPLSTRDVFRSLGAAPCQPSARLAAFPLGWTCGASAAACLHEARNDLEPAAIRLEPVVRDVLDTIQGLPGCTLARLSGSGPTCFGLFETREQAYQAKDALASVQPGWWAEATTLS